MSFGLVLVVVVDVVVVVGIDLVEIIIAQPSPSAFSPSKPRAEIATVCLFEVFCVENGIEFAGGQKQRERERNQ